ncbi:hypothetical protein B9Z19DRAFT_418927 [Tuber borchii]|uniref:Uncharacterized protein n=1 Tax=Tuber borchii TaxID=42251 RepID=A0A2T7A403_TUBBO|nr:hypothetical protein B9Z19DRAFT_418927 [Tuber borchii]
MIICKENNLLGMGLITLILPATTLHVISRKGSSLTLIGDLETHSSEDKSWDIVWMSARVCVCVYEREYVCLDKEEEEEGRRGGAGGGRGR